MERVAVIGLGNISTRHRRNLKLLFPDVELFAMPASGRIPKAEVTDCDQLVTCIDDLINYSVQLVIVASPATYHAQHTIPLIEAGIPVLIEKPITANNADALAIQRVVEKYKTPVAVGYCMRYLPSTIKIKKLLGQGRIGTLYNAFVEIGQYLPDWRPAKDFRESVSANPDLGGGALLELSHEFDYILWLLGSLSVEHAILRSSEELSLDVEDSADILATSSNGVVASIHLDFLQRKSHRKCRFVGSKSVLEWDLLKNEIIEVSNSSDEYKVIFRETEWDKNQMYLAMIADFMAHIDGEENQLASIDEGIQIVSLIEEIKKSYPINKNIDSEL